MNKILLTFDYEIYFDGYNHHQKLLANTDSILSIATKYNTHLVFFVDVYYLIKLRDFKLMNEFELIKNQVLKMIELGHEVQYHFHPHWIHAEYDRNTDKWTFDKTEYALSDILFKYGFDFTESKFELGIHTLKELFGVNPVAYRAGGLTIDKNQEELIQMLHKNNIKFDSSVMPGLCLKGDFIDTDHRISSRKSYWKVSDNFLKEGSSNTLFEVPVMSIDRKQLNFFKRILTSLKYRYKTFINRKEYKQKKAPRQIIDLIVQKAEYPVNVTFDKSNLRDIILFKFFTREFLNKDKHIMCILSHPKSFIDTSFNVFEMYIIWVRKQKDLQFVGFKDLNLD